MFEKERAIDESTLLVTEYDPRREKVFPTHIVHACQSLFREYEATRQQREETWLEAWAAYLGTPQSQQWVKRRIAQVVGDVEGDWRHQLSASKAFEVVETINSWLQGAFFPNKNWFDLLPRMAIGDPSWKKFLRTMKKYMSKKLDDANFQAWWNVHTRQTIVVGTSCLALPWRYETKRTYKNVLVRNPHLGDSWRPQQVERIIYNAPDLEVLNMFDVYLDPSCPDPNKAHMVRRMVKTKGEVIRLVESGVYQYGNKQKIQEELKPKDAAKADKRKEFDNFVGITDSTGYWSPLDTIEVFEFWGCLELHGVQYSDVVVTWSGNCLLNIETNPFWDGKPFVFSTLIPVQDSPYGLGLDPILGNIHEMNITMNQRLDNGEIGINKTYWARNDGTVDLDQVYSAPGHVIPVAEKDAIGVLESSTDFQYSITEEQLLERKIEKATGTTAFIGSSQGRSGERVTAEEVGAQKEAGGNRLNAIHQWIEYTSLLMTLKRLYAFMQQFVTTPEVVRVRGDEQNTWEYLEVGQYQLSIDMDVIPLGADHIANKEFELRNRMDFIKIATNVQQFQNRINWDALLVDIASRFLEEDYERFLVEETDADSQSMGELAPEGGEMVSEDVPVDVGGGRVATVQPDDFSELENAAEFSGGKPAVNALRARMMSQPAEDLLTQLGQALGVSGMTSS